MKAKTIIMFIILIFAVFTIRVRISAFPTNCQRIEKSLRFKDDPNFPKKAKAKIIYCKEYEGDFVIEIHAQDFPPNRLYKVTLNGWINRPGNNHLLRFNNWNGEGYEDIDTISTDNNGNIDTTVSFNLPPSDYHIKFFLKMDQKPYKCVMGIDAIDFTIKLPNPITFDLSTKIEGVTKLIEGKVNNPSDNIYVFVHPMKTKKWWVQQIPIPDKNGLWYCLCYFGTETEGINEHFQVISLIGKNKGEFNQGQTIAHNQMLNLLDQYQSCGPKITQRIK